MLCTRLTNNLRIETDGTMYPCCAMQGAPRFKSEAEMRQSDWFGLITGQFQRDEWPIECRECQKFEAAKLSSLRERVNFYAFPNIEKRKDFLNIDL